MTHDKLKPMNKTIQNQNNYETDIDTMDVGRYPRLWHKYVYIVFVGR